MLRTVVEVFLGGRGRALSAVHGAALQHCHQLVPGSPTLPAALTHSHSHRCLHSVPSEDHGRGLLPSRLPHTHSLQGASAACGSSSIHSSSAASMCRWNAAQMQDQWASGTEGAGQGSEPVNLAESSLQPQPQQPEAKDSETAGVRMESQVVFDACWRKFEERHKLKNVHVPREMVFLLGAPGAGKGANTVHILKTRGLDTSISVSSLLVSHPEARALIEKGEMIPDMLVGDILLEALLANSCKSPECGVLVDGFPRTAVQVDMLKLLYDKLSQLHTLWANTPHEHQFPRPLFKVVVLYVDMETSIQRQKERAKLASMHNERVKDAGAGELWEQRATDVNIEKCKRRYEIFKSHYGATMRLKQFFPFHLIDSMGSLEETQEAISLELRYQSSLDLSQATYSAIRHLPLSRDLAQHARQQLVSRLDDHCQKFPDLFHQVIDIITLEIMPVLRESGMAGRVEFVSHSPLFTEHPRTTSMLIDVLTDRGFSVSHTADVSHVPEAIDLRTGVIRNRQEVKHRFHIHWDTKGVREMAKAIEIATRMADVAPKDSAQISQSFIPSQMSYEAGRPNYLAHSNAPPVRQPQHHQQQHPQQSQQQQQGAALQQHAPQSQQQQLQQQQQGQDVGEQNVPQAHVSMFGTTTPLSSPHGHYQSGNSVSSASSRSPHSSSSSSTTTTSRSSEGGDCCAPGAHSTQHDSTHSTHRMHSTQHAVHHDDLHQDSRAFSEKVAAHGS